MRDVDEVELRVALAEGVLSRSEAEQLGQEARRLERSPLELLRERGRLSEQSFLSLRAEARGALPEGLSPPEPPERGEPVFPVPDWERYRCVRFLGQGGMGRVFLAQDPRLHREVALKFVRDEGAALNRRFISEARAQARVNHDRVCKVYEVGEVQGRVYIAMQYIAGTPLNALAHELTVEQKAMVLRDAAQGVHEAHRAGLIHRDLKPSNILVERTDDGVLKPYVMDFGLARDWKQELTATGAVLGTPHYMAPEQARGELATLDRRADVYSLGATLYSVLTGAPPIPGDNGLEVLNNIATSDPLPPRARVPSLPEDLEAIVLKSLEKERSARYDSARALAEDLERFLSGEPVRARATGTWYRAGKWLRRHRTLAAVSAAALLAVLLALGWAGLQRREVLTRERLARRFTEQVEGIEATARYSALSRLHDIRADRRALRASMARLEEEVRDAGAPALGPGHYALGRGMWALGEEDKAREHLERAWESGYREPRVAWALALVLGRIYQRQLLEAERLREPSQREARERDIQRRFREPTLVYLRQSQGAALPSTRYGDALLAFYEDRLDEALGHLDAIEDSLPWAYEVPQLRGDILLARATRHGNAGERDQALADFEAGRRAYTTAADTAESVPEIPLALGELEYAALLMELYGQGDVLPHFTRGLEAVTRALAISPEDYDATVLKARLYKRRAEDLTNHGRDAESTLNEAAASAQAALTLAPRKPRARLELGSISLQWAQELLGRGEDAHVRLEQSLDAFASLGPEDQDATFHMQLGLAHGLQADDTLQRGGDPRASLAAAIDAYRTALQLDERSALAWTSLGNMYLTRATSPRAENADGDLEQALFALQKARALNPRSVVACFYAADAHVQRALRLTNRGGEAGPSWAKALELYQQGIALQPGLPHLYNGAGEVLREQARAAWARGEAPFPLLAQAQSVYEKALALAPEQGFAQNNLGKTHAERARYRLSLGQSPREDLLLARRFYQESRKYIPDHAIPWANLAELWNIQATHEWESQLDPEASLMKSLDAAREALERNPELDDAWLQRGEALALQAHWRARKSQPLPRDFERAEQAFQRAMELTPDNPQFQLAASRFYLRWATGRLDSERQEFLPLLTRGLTLVEKVLMSRPSWAAARALREGFRMRLSPGQAEAQEELRRILARNPQLKQEWSGEGDAHLP